MTFLVNDIPLESRLLPAGDRAPVAAAGVSLRLITAYRGIQSDTLIITLEAANQTESEATFATYDADYLGPTGKQAKAAQAVGLPISSPVPRSPWRLPCRPPSWAGR